MGVWGTGRAIPQKLAIGCFSLSAVSTKNHTFAGSLSLVQQGLGFNCMHVTGCKASIQNVRSQSSY